MFWIRKAVAVYKKGVEYNSRAPDLYFGLGEVYYTASLIQKSKDYTLAKKAFSNGLKLQPYLEAGYVLLAQCYIKEGNRDKAIWLLKKVLKINPNYRPAQENLFRLKAPPTKRGGF